MLIDPNYDRYYVYSSVYLADKQVAYGACPLIRQPEVVLQGGKWKSGLTWADGNYHLHDCTLISDEAQFIEECMFSALNEAEETSGVITLNELNCIVRWCLLEEEQVRVVMNLPL